MLTHSTKRGNKQQQEQTKQLKTPIAATGYQVNWYQPRILQSMRHYHKPVFFNY